MKIKSDVLYAILAFVWWGLSPLFWKQLSYLPGDEVLAYRIFFTLVILFSVLFLNHEIKKIPSIIKNKKLMIKLFIASLMLGVNWYAFIYAVNSNQVMQTSLGYFMNPLMNVFIGFIVFKETLGKLEIISLVLAFIGLIVLASLGPSIPWLSITIACTFATYGAIKKSLKISPFLSQFVETSFLSLPVIIYLFNLEMSGNGHITSYPDNLLMIVGGFVTLFPLLLFAKAASSLEFKTLGFIQYLSPTLQFLLSVFVYKEPFKMEQLAAFSLIWIALIIYTSKNFMTKKPI